jgi:tRNA(Ile)-lysidine synthetase-like protein
VRVPWGGGISAELVEASGADFSPAGDEEYVRPDIKAPLTVRTPGPGDRFRPLGSPFRRKLKDFFIDVKLPRRERRKVSLVMEEDRVVWVVGLRLDDRYKLRPSDRQAIRLRRTQD